MLKTEPNKPRRALAVTGVQKEPVKRTSGLAKRKRKEDERDYAEVNNCAKRLKKEDIC